MHSKTFFINVLTVFVLISLNGIDTIILKRYRYWYRLMVLIPILLNSIDTDII